MITPFIIFVTLVGGYLATTLILWIAHWFAHVSWSPLRGFHVGGHHALYPDRQHCLTKRFIFGAGRHDSIYAFVPWLAIEAVAVWAILPSGIAILTTVESGLLIWLFSYVHEQFHLVSSRFVSSSPFLRARTRHLFHHDCDANFAVFDHFWDRVFGTFIDPTEATDHERMPEQISTMR
jgi:sterol desaturase/sphingolipid hydroxylase (fatty acid hydroxylase superfamily)